MSERQPILMGTGSYGTVLKVWDVKTGKPMALKLFTGKGKKKGHEEAVKREFAALAIMHKLGVGPKPFRWGILPGTDTYFIEMELARGQSLSALRKRKTPLDSKELAQLKKAFEKAIRTLHAAGLAHQDIKPDNVFYDTETNRVQFIDGGMVCGRGEEEEACSSRRGTPNYMSPAKKKARNSAWTVKDAQEDDLYGVTKTLRNVAAAKNKKKRAK